MRSDSLSKKASLFGLFTHMLAPEKIFSPKLFLNPSIKNVSRGDDANILLSSLVINILGLALPIFTLQVYDRIIAHHGNYTLNLLVFFVLIALTLEVTLRIFRSQIMSRKSAVLEHIISCNILRHSLAADLNHAEKASVGERMLQSHSVSRVRDFLSGQALVSLIDIPFAFIYLALIYYISPPLAYVAVAILSLFFVVATFLSVVIKNLISAKDESEKSRMAFVVDVLNNIHNIKAQALENKFMRNFEYLQNISSKQTYFITKLSSLTAGYSSVFNQLMVISIIGVGVTFAVHQHLSFGALIAVMLLAGRLMNPFQKALSLWMKFQSFIISAEKINEIFNVPILERVDVSHINQNDAVLKIEGLNFAYDSESLLKDVNLVLKKGSVISISGEHGTGKTTFLKLIAGLYNPTSGRILINDIPPTFYPARQLVRSIGYLSTEGIIFRGSIYENLSAFSEIPSQNIDEIINLLDLEKEILKLPEGFDTMLEGTQSDPIPPGLKQRIAIARTLAYKPKIILFDNADKALDTAGYNSLYRLFARLKGKATLILVSDDYNMIRLATKEYVLESLTLKERNYADNSKVYDIKPFTELRISAA